MAKALCLVSDIPVFQQTLRNIKAKYGEESTQMTEALMEYSGPNRGLKWDDKTDTLTVANDFEIRGNIVCNKWDDVGPGFSK